MDTQYHGKRNNLSVIYSTYKSIEKLNFSFFSDQFIIFKRKPNLMCQNQMRENRKQTIDIWQKNNGTFS